MTKAFVLYAHPCEESFSSALHRTVVKKLTSRGWDVDDCDLNAEGFDPVMTAYERRAYHDTVSNRVPVATYVDRLKAADALVMVFPVWNFGYPAILKGFLDRVFLPGVSFEMDAVRLTPTLTNVKKLAAVTTYGGGRRRAIFAGDPPRRSFCRAVRYVCQPDKLKYLALYGMNRRTDAERAAFLKKVDLEMGEF
ncbi:MAG: NAD(P)H-dependent oxidoreductase [Pseudomonadota bacterium]